MIQVSGGDGGGRRHHTAVVVQTLNCRVEGGQVQRRISFPVTPLLFLALFLLIIGGGRGGVLLLLSNLSTLLLDPGKQTLDLPVGRTQATGLDQVLQGGVELPER